MYKVQIYLCAINISWGMWLGKKCLKRLLGQGDNIEKKLRNTGLGKEMVYVTDAFMA